MDFEDSPTEAAFRAEVRAWFDAHAELKDTASQSLSVLQGFDDTPEGIALGKKWQRELFDAGWGALTWPKEYGGRGAGPLESIVYNEELARYDVPVQLFTIGLGMIGPTIIAHGSDEQKQRYLPPMATGDEIWCQLWSEPDAGSDLAGLKSRAERDGDDFVLNGQKVWTSGAHYCDLGLGVFRTDPDVPKHHGISAFIVPMDTSGVEVRPLKQLNGASHFNEVFFNDVRLPAANLVGDYNDGWRVARTTMMNERLSAGAMVPMSDTIAPLLTLARETRADTVARQRVARAYTLARLFDLTTARVRTALSRNAIPGPEVSVLKLFAAIAGTDVALAGAGLVGAAGMLLGDHDAEATRWGDSILASFAMHIGGGTDEIQRNIIGETVLGLPREPSFDRDVPFRELGDMHVAASKR
ncbi:MAG TPA: acyl-CoA dehydrogenase family protein [Acidimicrobiales bacterium]|nr:acyl-CoA dehydrogenase family protein [Acidimicrobiales bacterium]